MSVDNLCKYLAEQHPQDFSEWLLGEPLPNVEVLKTELSIEPIRADSVTFLRGTNRILHLEFQTEPTSEPALPLRMLDYWVRLYRKHGLPVTQVLLILKETNVEIPSVFTFERTRHEYGVVKMWEQEPAPLLQNVNLLPLASLAKAINKTALLQSIAKQIKQVNDDYLRGNLLSQTNFLAGLRFDAKLINLLLKENFMRESVTYQAVLQEGREEGILQGIHQGRIETILQLLTRRIGKTDRKTRNRINKLSATELEKFTEALLEFASPEDVQNWFAPKSN